MKTRSYGLHTIHQLDSIYNGQLNNSYQKDGFGLQQTFNFDTYIGYWKNNKIEGLGLVILSNGTFIYANFARNAIDGMAIIDNGHLLICGIYRDGQIVGVGFEYNHQLKICRMNRYHKGVSIQTIKQQACNLSSSLPKIINVQQSLYFHLYKYVTKQFFDDLDISIYTEISNGVFLYGFTNQNGFNGPGIVIKNYQLVQAGFYEDGLLHGFGIKIQKSPYKNQFGCFHKGRKDGEFMEKQEKQTKYFLYRKGILLKNLPDSEGLLIKNQKKYNFNCKDFFSAKNNIPFDTFKTACLAPQVRQYKQKKQQSQRKNLKKVDNYTTLSLKRQQKKSAQKGKGSPSRSYVLQQQKEKSSVQIMRQKMGHYYGLVSGRKRGDTSPKKTSSKMETYSNQEDVVAFQENPFF